MWAKIMFILDNVKTIALFQICPDELLSNFSTERTSRNGIINVSDDSTFIKCQYN